MSPRPSSSSSQLPSSSSGSTESLLGLGTHKWLRLLFVVVALYLLFLPIWWYSVEFLSVILAACADPIYRLFDSTVTIRPSGRLIDFYVTSSAQGASQAHSSALKADTITYGIPMVIALSIATRADSILAKFRAVAVGTLLMLAVSVPFVMVWAKMTSLQLEEQTSIAGARGARSTFLYFAFHGYAFSQPVVAVGIWLGMFLLGVFRKRQSEETPSVAVSRNAPCPCGSGRKYKRCCGRGK